MLSIISLYHDIEQLKNVNDFNEYLNHDFENIKTFLQSKNREEIDNEKFNLENLLFVLEDNKLISKDNNVIVNEFLVLLFHCFETIQFESTIRVLLSYLKSTETNYQIQANIKFLNINNITQDYHCHFDEILSLLDISTLKQASKKTLLIYFLIAMKNFSRITNDNLSNSFKLLFKNNQNKFSLLKDKRLQNIINLVTLDNIDLKFNYLLDNLAFLLIEDEEEINSPVGSTKSFQPTKEQLEIIKTSQEMEQGQVLIIEALAGCTKTSTLEMITKENPESKFLYLAFNKKIVEDAKSRFPSNTEVKTLHALAFKHKEADKNIVDNRVINNIIAELFDLEITSEFYKIDDIRKVYDDFCGSENNLDELHKLERRLINEIELEYSNKPENEQNNKNFFINKIEKAIPHIPRLWEYMENSNITTHSTYLKTFVENNHSLNYDFIVLDESQDVSRVLGKFIINSILSYNYKVIVVGDNNQKIYGFLGNVNLSKAIKQVVNNSIYIEKNLTKTFRFSKDSSVENLTNLILKLRNIAIIAAKKTSETKEEGKVLKTGYLSRGKLPVLIKALEFLENKMDFNLFMSIEQDFDMNLLIDIYELYRYTMKVKNDLINQGLSTSSLAKCDASFYNRNDKDTKKDIEYIVKKFRDNKENAIFPNFINKRLRKILSLYELEYISYKNQDVTMLDNLKIIFFILNNFEFIHNLETKENYSHIVEKSLSILIKEFSNENSLNIISTIHKVKGLEYEKVILIESSNIQRKISLRGDDIIELLSSSDNILGFCSSENPNCKKVEKKKNPSYSIDFGEIFDNGNATTQFSLQDIKQEDRNQTAEELFIDKNIDTQEEYNILYVGITRAEEIIEIENLKYENTLTFLKFIAENIIEIDKIINDETSSLLIRRNSNKGEIGIVYEKYFISVETLKEFMVQFAQYNE